MIKNLVNIVRKNGGRIMVNEVTTGTGRTGLWWGFQHYGIHPDLAAVGKGIGNGYPVSAAVMDENCYNELKNSAPFLYAQSHQNDALGAAVVEAVIGELSDGCLIEQGAELGTFLLEQLKTMVDGMKIKAVRGRGLMLCVDLADEAFTQKVYSRLTEKGYIVCNRRTAIRIDPPLIVTKEELSEFIDVLRGVVQTTEL